jgi:predicted site-specific integrase-resolvase
MPLSFAQAAQQIGLHKSNLLRVITAGRVSALRDDSGNRRLDESEPVRVYGDLSSATLQPAHPDLLLQLKLEHAEQRIGDLERQLERALCDVADWKEMARRTALPTPSASWRPALPAPSVARQPAQGDATLWQRFLHWRRAS